MDRIVVDTNIFIDYNCAGILDDIFKGKFEILTPNIVYEYELIDHYPELIKLGLIAIDINQESQLEVDKLFNTYGGVSHEDCCVIMLAEELGHRLLSGDKLLRKFAENRGIEVHGTLWLMKSLVDCGVLSVGKAANSLEKMLEQGRRLPTPQTQELIKEFRDQDI